MPKQDKETVRGLLSAVLRKLEGETVEGTESSTPIVFSETANQGSPMILVFVGALDSSASSPARGTERVLMTTPLAATRNEIPAAHPGLERFPLAISEPSPFAVKPSATKPCFIEPGRACCSSGACEMRGF